MVISVSSSTAITEKKLLYSVAMGLTSLTKAPNKKESLNPALPLLTIAPACASLCMRVETYIGFSASIIYPLLLSTVAPKDSGMTICVLNIGILLCCRTSNITGLLLEILP